MVADPATGALARLARAMASTNPRRASSDVGAAKRAVGSGPSTRTTATSECGSPATSTALNRRPDEVTAVIERAPATAPKVVATRPPAATATPHAWTTPWAVTTWRDTMASRSARTATGTSRQQPVASVSVGAIDPTPLPGPGTEPAAPSSRTPAATAAAAAPAIRPVATERRRRVRRTPDAAGPGSAGTEGADAWISEGCRQSRSSGDTHPRSGTSASPATLGSTGLVVEGSLSIPLRRPSPGRPRRDLDRSTSQLITLPTQEPAKGSPQARTIGTMPRDLAIDLGTANTLVYAKGKGIVLNEPTVVALDTRSRQVLAMGDEAWQMIGRTPGYIVAVRPMRQGAVTDFEITERMLELLFRRVGVSRLNRPRVLICVPSAITAVERRAVKEAARRAGAASCFLIEQPMAAAIGAGLAIDEPIGSMVVDVGGGTSEMAVISLGGLVATRAIRCGGFDLDADIQTYVRTPHGMAIGERTAEAIKLAIGSAHPYDHERQAEIRGREVATGRPKTVLLARGGARRRWGPRGPDRGLSRHVPRRRAPDLAQDIIFEGIHLVGGGALLRGLSQRLADETSVPVHQVDAPLECVALGAGRASSPSSGFARCSPPPSAEPAASPLEQHLGRLTDLPVVIGQAPLQRGVDLGALEGGQGDGRPAPHRHLVVEGTQHAGPGPWDRRPRPARRPPRPRGSGHRHAKPPPPPDRRRRPSSVARPAPSRRPPPRADRDRSRPAPRPGQGRTRSTATNATDSWHALRRTVAEAIGEGGGHVVDLERAGPGQRPDGGGPHRGVRIVQGAAGLVDGASVTGHDRAAQPGPRRLIVRC